MKEIILIEKEEECLQYQSMQIKGMNGGELKPIALGPEVECYFDRMGIKFLSIEDYTSPTEINRVGFRNFSRRDRLCSYIDKTLEVPLQNIYGTSFTPGYYYAHFFKVLLDAISIRLLYLNNMLRKEKPFSVYYFETKEDINIIDSFFLDESIFSQLLPIVCKHLRINSKIIKTVSQKHSPESEGSKKQDFYTKIINKYNLPFLKKYPLAFIKGMLDNPRKNHKRTLLIVQPWFYDIKYLVEEWIRNRTYNIINWNPEDPSSSHFIFPLKSDIKLNYPNSSFKDTGRNLWKKLAADKKFQHLFNFQDINTLPVVKKRLSYFFCYTIDKIAEAYLKTYECIEKYKVGLLMLSSAVRYTYRAAIHAARNLKVPVVIYQHGGLYGYCEEPEKEIMELENCDYYFSFGSEVAKYLSKKKSNGPKIFPVGSTSLSYIYHKHKESKKASKSRIIKTIMYISSEGLGNQWFISNSNYPNIYLFCNQIRIIETLIRFKQFRIIVKLSPNSIRNKAILKYLSFQKKENMEIINTPLKQVIHKADTYILDHPATAFLECLATGKPTFIYFDKNFIRTTVEARQILNKDSGIVFSEDMDEFLKKISDFFEANARPSYSYKNINHHFIRSYGLGNCLEMPVSLGGRIINKMLE